MNSKAQIKRATALGQRAVEKLDAEAAQALIDLYRAQAADIGARIRAHAGPDDNLALQEMRAVLDQVDGILRRLSAERDALLEEALGKAAEYGARPVLGTVLDTGAVVSSAASAAVAERALFFVQTFIAEEGLQLSDRIWRLDRGARDAIVNALESAVIQGHGAAQAAREFLARGEAVPGEVAGKITAANASALSRRAQELMTGTGAPLDNALRLFRTEINRAHGEAYMMGGEDHPDFGGWRFLLSPSHPKPDICDLLSTQNVHGLGPGVYPSREQCPWPAHPNTLSFVEIVFKDEITAADRAGKETPLQALSRLTPEQRAGALGKGKSQLHDRGKLTQGMIRAPLKAVRERLGDNAPMSSIETLSRAAWGGFPDVLIHAEESIVKKHPDYAAAKAGDIAAAKRLVVDTIRPGAIDAIRQSLGASVPTVVAVQALEESGVNVIPTALSGLIGRRLGLPVDDSIVQINRVGHTGADGYHRLATPALFDGEVRAGAHYLLVDDFVGQGGTLANLRGYIEAAGGRVDLATTLTGKGYSSKLALSDDTLAQLRAKHGGDLETWWKAHFGYGFDFLTESEARYLVRSPDADAIRDRILAAEKEAR